MRNILFSSAVIVAGTFAAMPSQAQGGAFMWCQATASTDTGTTVYYSAFFSAGAWEADVKARAFKSEIAVKDASASTVTAKCAAPGDYDAAVASRNTAMKAAPGKIISWEG